MENDHWKPQQLEEQEGGAVHAVLHVLRLCHSSISEESSSSPLGSRFMPALLLVVSCVAYETSSVLVMKVISDFYLIISSQNSSEFLSCLGRALLVVTLVSLCKSSKLCAIDYTALQWRLRLVSLFHCKLKIHPARTHIALASIENADQRLTQDASRLTEKLVSVISAVLTTPGVVIFYTYYLASLFGFIAPLACYFYFFLGSTVAYFQARKIVPCVYEQEAQEGHYRRQCCQYKLCHEDIFFLQGDSAEIRRLSSTFNQLVKTVKALIWTQLPLSVAVNWFNYFGSIVNYAVIGLCIIFLQQKTNEEELTEAEIASLLASGSYACLYLISAFSTILDSFEDISEGIALTRRVLEFSEALGGVECTKNNIELGGRDFDTSNEYFDDDINAIEITCQTSESSFPQPRGCDLLLDVRDLSVCIMNYPPNANRRFKNTNGCTRSQLYDNSDAGDTSPLMDSEDSLVSGRYMISRGKQLLPSFNLQLYKGMQLLVVGPSGCGKTMLLRTLAGLFNFHQPHFSLDMDMNPRGASVKYYIPHEKVLFLPQNSYVVEGSLEDNVCYPQEYNPVEVTDDDDGFSLGKFNTRRYLEAIQSTGLADILLCRNSTAECETVKIFHSTEANSTQFRSQSIDGLSGGQRQRIGFARAIYSGANLVFLDESTSALDEEAEASLYAALRRHCPTFVSTGHRSSLCHFHTHLLRLDGEGGYGVEKL